MGLSDDVLSDVSSSEGNESESPRVAVFLENFAGDHMTEFGHVVFEMLFIKVYWESTDEDLVFLAKRVRLSGMGLSCLPMR